VLAFVLGIIYGSNIAAQIFEVDIRVIMIIALIIVIISIIAIVGAPLFAAFKYRGKDPSEALDFINNVNRSFFTVFGRGRYWIDNKGIWELNKLICTWNEVKDI
jgi:hypothetical protein